jgi:hypothetical protein
MHAYHELVAAMLAIEIAAQKGFDKFMVGN